MYTTPNIAVKIAFNEKLSLNSQYHTNAIGASVAIQEKDV